MSLVKLASGKQLFVESAGTGSPILFLHGLGSNVNFYQATNALSGLEKTHRLVRYDFDGHGLSPVSGETVSIRTLVEDLKGVMDALEIEKAGVVAHSMSGLVATTFASLYPERVAKLFLIGPVKAMPAAGQEAMTKRAAAVRAGGMSAIVDAVVAGATSAKTKATSPLSLAIIRALVLPTKVEGYAKACEALASAENPDWSKIEAETLVLGGEEDYLVNAEAVEFLKSSIKNAKAKTLLGCGHWHAVEQPQETADELRAFFA